MDKFHQLVKWGCKDLPMRTFRTALEEIYILPKWDIEEDLHSDHASEKVESRKALSIILKVTAFLPKQGMPLRGDREENDS